VHLGTPAAEILAALLAYLIGGVPFGWLFARAMKGIDLRTIGSGNVGATNAARLWTGRRAIVAFVVVFVLDCAKGFAAAWLSPALGRWLGASTENHQTMAVICGSAAILGHVFTPYLSFRGGKGVATTLGVVAALATWPAIYAVGAWGVLVALTGYVSLGSIVAMVSIPFTYLFRLGPAKFTPTPGVLVFLTAVATIVVWRHRENIARLLRGHERKVGACQRVSKTA
jgi:glycerol-3-phosphate acyltransferase PlsY